MRRFILLLLVIISVNAYADNDDDDDDRDDDHDHVVHQKTLKICSNAYLKISLALSILNKVNPFFGIVKKTWIPGQTLKLKTDGTVVGTGIANHLGGQTNAGKIIFTGITNRAVHIAITVHAQPSNSNFVFQSPMCALGTTQGQSFSTNLNAINELNCGATLTINTSTVSSSSLDGATWKVDIHYL